MIRYLALLIVLYLVSYGAFRTANAEVRALDGATYVIYASAGAVYLLFRPLAYVDNIATGMRSHIGPHPEEVQQ